MQQSKRQRACWSST